ncbi:MAG: hypothetical protein A2096_04095 [Spirochaetes bacterium GWF1_41_5]|nr:MAG: hypothetical protein A2096_04095 [Spirochaetes bacterium GWF1_41_5]HBE03304.1 hypothetical protein [Spirochaetia bacterium]
MLYCTKIDLAWIICLYKAKVLDSNTAAAVMFGNCSVQVLPVIFDEAILFPEYDVAILYLFRGRKFSLNFSLDNIVT